MSTRKNWSHQKVLKYSNIYMSSDYYACFINGQGKSNPALALGETVEEVEANAKLICASRELLKEHITDVKLIEEFINGDPVKWETVKYFLSNLLVSKKLTIKKATK